MKSQQHPSQRDRCWNQLGNYSPYDPAPIRRIGAARRELPSEARPNWHIRFIPLSRFSDMSRQGGIKESGLTYSENATKKALFWAKQTGLPALAEDSGIEVKALGWQPALHSARFASSNKHKNASDVDNNQKLLKKLSGLPMSKRLARYRSSVVIALPDGRVIAKSEGVCWGRIAFEPRGKNGFGYDPIFIPNAPTGLLPDACPVRDENNTAELTFGQMPANLKHLISHRGKSIRKIFKRLIQILDCIGNYIKIETTDTRR